MSGLGRRLSFAALSLLFGLAISVSGIISAVSQSLYITRALLSSFAVNALGLLIFSKPLGVRLKSLRLSGGRLKSADFFLLTAFAFALCVSCGIVPDCVSLLTGSSGGEYAFNPLDLIALALIPAVIEEWSFRKIIIGAFAEYGEGFAVFISALLFGLSHESPAAALYAFLCGLVLGGLYAEARSLAACIIVHFLCNSLTIACAAFEGRELYYAVLAMAAILAAALLAVVKVRRADIFQHEAKTNTAVFKAAFMNPLMIILLAAYIIRIVV